MCKLRHTYMLCSVRSSYVKSHRRKQKSQCVATLGLLLKILLFVVCEEHSISLSHLDKGLIHFGVFNFLYVITNLVRKYHDWSSAYKSMSDI